MTSPQRIEIALQRLPHLRDLPLPSHATTSSAGLDLVAAIGQDIVLQPGERRAIPSGICIALPAGYEAQIRSRSGLAIKNGVVVLNAPGTIDADYRGEIMGILINLGNEPFTITPGMRFAQMVISTYAQVTWDQVEILDETVRGQGGFGSTGLAAAS